MKRKLATLGLMMAVVLVAPVAYAEEIVVKMGFVAQITLGIHVMNPV